MTRKVPIFNCILIEMHSGMSEEGGVPDIIVNLIIECKRVCLMCEPMVLTLPGKQEKARNFKSEI